MTPEQIAAALRRARELTAESDEPFITLADVVLEYIAALDDDSDKSFDRLDAAGMALRKSVGARIPTAPDGPKLGALLAGLNKDRK